MQDEECCQKDFYLLRAREAQKLEERFPKSQRLRLYGEDYIRGTITYLYYAKPNDLAYFYVDDFRRVTCELMINHEAVRQSLGSQVVFINGEPLQYGVVVKRKPNIEQQSNVPYLASLWDLTWDLENEKEWLYYFMEDSRWVFYLTMYGETPLLFKSELNDTARMICNAALEARRLTSMSKYDTRKKDAE